MGIDGSDVERGIWSIGLMRGPHLGALKLVANPNPIVSGADFQQWEGRAVADPFAIFRDEAWYLFFELFQRGSDVACIGASKSTDLKTWDPIGIVLQPGHHLSYPFVFEHDGQIYMMPESKSVRRVDIYRAVEFPYRWEFEKTILRGRLMDCSMVQHNGRFWIFAGWRSHGLKLFHATHPLGPWKSHCLPFIRAYSKSSSRPGGRPVHVNNQLVRFSQDNVVCYGHQLRAWQVTCMNRFWYSERPLFNHPILAGSGKGWNAHCMHHIDPFRVSMLNTSGLEPSNTTATSGEEWLAFVDGCA
jgi:hypothetical protein